MFLYPEAPSALPPLPLEYQEVLDNLPLPSGAPAPWPRRLGPARTLPAERTDYPEFVHSVYSLTSASPSSCSGFASLMPACCNRPSLPIPSHRQQLPEDQDCALATSFANPGWWSGLHVTCSLLQAVVDFCPWVSPISRACTVFVPSPSPFLPIPCPSPFWQLGKPSLGEGPGFP